jgi:lipid II:glycine glycyltransferase (peptidoglycan interpeptide bridge formation enzyme)
MGPLLEGPLEDALVRELADLFSQRRIAYVEVAGRCLDETILAAAGFDVRQRETWVLDIEGNEQDQWEKLHHNCRKNIRKAERSNLIVSELHDARFFPRLYELVVRTFKKKGLAIPFAYRRLELLQDTIGRNDQMLFLGAFHQDAFIGGHIWGHDRHTAYALIVGHDETYDPFRVTNMLIWEGIRRFVGKGLKKYDMYGGSRSMDGVTRFKSSFGSHYVASSYYSLNLSPLFQKALFIYEHWYLRGFRQLRRLRRVGKADAS